MSARSSRFPFLGLRTSSRVHASSRLTERSASLHGRSLRSRVLDPKSYGRPAAPGSGAQDPRAAGSVTLVALLAPGVAVVAVAGALPEPGLVAGGETHPADPLGALPEVQVRDHHPG